VFPDWAIYETGVVMPLKTGMTDLSGFAGLG
jgi:hypothetical protein